MSGPLHLTISREGDVHIIDLYDRGPFQPMKFQHRTQVTKKFLDDLCTAMERLAVRSATGRFRDTHESRLSLAKDTSGLVTELQGLGQIVYSHLLTEPVGEQLKNSAPGNLYLTVDEQLLPVPWELCFDGTDFLATKFCLGRQVNVTGPGRPPVITGGDGKELRVLLIADPTESLPGANAEVEQLLALLDTVPFGGGKLIAGKGVGKPDLLRELSGTDIVHFAGHSVFDAQDPSRSGWCLSDDDILTAAEISKLYRPPRLVFSNSCWAGATGERQKQERYAGGASGLGSAFLQAGVENFIGTFWPIPDTDSRFFALAFYRALIDGQTLGSALLHARHETVGAYGWDSLTWGSYMLYGDPAATSFTSQPTASPTPRSHPETPPLDARLHRHDVAGPDFRLSRESGNPSFRAEGSLEMGSRFLRPVPILAVAVSLVLALALYLLFSPAQPGGQALLDGGVTTQAPSLPAAPVALRLAVMKRRADLVSVLKEGEELTSGDYYGVFFEPAQPSFVYVLQQDATGKIDILFPDPKVTAQTNPVPASKAVWVPQDEKHWFYLDQNRGREVIIVAASRQRDEKLESLLHTLSDKHGQGALAQWMIAPERGRAGVKQLETTPRLSPAGKSLNLETALVQGNGSDFVYTVGFAHK